jgi:hypothetical protein
MLQPLKAIGQPWHWIAVGASNPDFLQNVNTSILIGVACHNTPDLKKSTDRLSRHNFMK